MQLSEGVKIKRCKHAYQTLGTRTDRRTCRFASMRNLWHSFLVIRFPISQKPILNVNV